MDTEAPMLSPNAGEALFINQECLQDGPSSRKVCLCQIEGSTGPLPLITLSRRSSMVKAIRWRLMHVEPQSGLISLKCSEIDSPQSHTKPRDPICPEIGSADKESGPVKAHFKIT